MIRKKCVNNILNKSIVFAFVLFVVALSTQSASAAMDRSETQTMGYHHFAESVIDKPPKADPWIERQYLVVGNVNVAHKMSLNKNINGLCAGETVNFNYDPILTYNSTGGSWDTPYGDWCDNTESGCNIDMKNGNYQDFFSANGHPRRGRVHWTAIKPNANIISSDNNIISCSGTMCTVKGSGSVILKAQIDETKARIWSVYNMTRIDRRDTSLSKSILGIERDAWDEHLLIASPTDDGRFYNLDFDYLISDLNTWGVKPAQYSKDEKFYSFPSVNNSKNLSWEVTVGCDSISQCGTKNGGNGKTLSEVPGTKCSDSSKPVATNTNTGWSWMCGTNSCSANRTCADTDGNGKCDATCDASKNEINNPNNPDECCVDVNNDGNCDTICNSPEIINPVYPTQCCKDVNHNGICDKKCNKTENKINDPNALDVCCYDRNDDTKCDAVASCDKSKNEISVPNDNTRCCVDANGDGICDSAPGGGSVTCPAGQSANPNNPTECCADPDGDGNCDCLNCEAGCLAPSIPNQVNLRRTGGAQDAKITIPAGLWCDINGNHVYDDDGTEGSASHSVVVSVPVTSHPTPVKYSCQCAPSKTPAGSPCSADKPERITAGGEKICCSDSEWDGTNKVCGKGKNVFSQDIQCVCLSKKCSASGSCIATPVFAKSYTDLACKSECSSNADCSGGSVIPVP